MSGERQDAQAKNNRRRGRPRMFGPGGVRSQEYEQYQTLVLDPILALPASPPRLLNILPPLSPPAEPPTPLAILPPLSPPATPPRPLAILPAPLSPPSTPPRPLAILPAPLSSPAAPAVQNPAAKPTTKRHRKDAAAAASGYEGNGFTPHFITVEAGEDILLKILSFAQNSAQSVWVLSAHGSISIATVRLATQETVTLEGRFEIISLSGSYLESENGGNPTGAMGIVFASQDGRVYGGAVAGVFLAASRVEVVVASFTRPRTKLNHTVPASRSPSPPTGPSIVIDVSD